MRAFQTAILGLCFTVSAATAYAQGVSSGLPSQRVLARFGLERAWWSHATMNPARESVRHISLDEEHLYMQSSGGVVTAFDNETGKRLWAVQLGRRDLPGYAAVSNGDQVLVVAGIQMFALDKFTGEIQWEIKLPKQPSTSPAIDNQRVYVGMLDGSIFAFDIRKINELYEENLLPQWSAESISWRFKSAKEVAAPPVTTGLVVSFASYDRSLYAVSSTNRKLRWQFETDHPVSAPLGRTKDSIFLAAEDLYVYCLDIENGQIRWDFLTSFPVRETPRIIDEQVFLIPDRGGMFCLSKSFGDLLWFQPNIRKFLGATRTRLFTSDAVGNIIVMSRKDGSSLGALPLRGYSVRLENDRTDRLYVATRSGLIVCLRELGQEFPRYHMNPELQPILPIFAPENAEDDADADASDDDVGDN